MKILLINTFSEGGAAKACIRLHLGLLKAGVDSRLLVLHGNTTNPIIASENYKGKRKQQAIPSLSNRIKKKLFPKRFFFDNEIKEEIKKCIPNTIEWFSFPDSGYELSEHPWVMDSDLINLHWVSDFVDFSIFKKVSKPIVWSMHDMNPFTGGCHYSGDCNLYTANCIKCPQLSSTHATDFSKRNISYKLKQISGVDNLTIVGLSNWLMDCSKKSNLFENLKHKLIPNGLDTEVYSPMDRLKARTELNLPLDKKIILFVAYGTLHTPRKGYAILLEAIKKLDQSDMVLCAVGGMDKSDLESSKVIDFGFVKSEDKLRVLYCAADLFVIPSIQDNLPNTVVESLLCGTPVVGFRTGGIPDMIKPGFNGELSDELTATGLYIAINKVLNQLPLYAVEKIREDAKTRFSQELQALRYSQLFSELLKSTDIDLK